MSITSKRPITPAQRGMTNQDFSQITSSRSLKSLKVRIKKHGGRNNKGRITTRHQGGGAKKFYRIINLNLAQGTSAKVEQIEYDPNRSARIARIKDQDNIFHYILATTNMKVGSKISSGPDAAIEDGNRLPLKNIPVGSSLHAIELQPGRGAQLVRSAGASAQLTAKEGRFASLKMPSGEVRMVNINCNASIGSVGNIQHQNVKLGKAGRKRRMGIRPTVRGVTMNAADHPHGGGDGGAHGPGKDPRTPWGQKTLGHKTRNRKSTSKYIVRGRHAAKRR